MTDALPCDCRPGFYLCPEADRLWTEHNAAWQRIVAFQREHDWAITKDEDLAPLNDLEAENRRALAEYRAHVEIDDA